LFVEKARNILYFGEITLAGGLNMSTMLQRRR
jgi:hypothetical protein